MSILPEPIKRSGKHLNWKEPQYCLNCGKQMRKRSDKTSLPRHESKGICHLCYKTPVRTLVVMVSDLHGQTCSGCREYMEYSNFSKDVRSKTGYSYTCRICNSVLRYGISKNKYLEMLANQNGGCYICGRTPEENGFSLSIDHDHNCCPRRNGCVDCVRGLLCNYCNRGLGLLQDSPEILLKAHEYLTKPPSGPTSPS